MGVQVCQHCSDSGEQRFQRRPAAKLEDNDPGAVVRWKSQNLSKIVIQGDKRPPLGRGGQEDLLVRDARQTLIANGDNVVAGTAEKLKTALANVLVEFELHATVSAGIGIIRSRVASAP